LFDGTAALGALAASSGAALVGFVQSGAGAVARTAQDKGREWVTPQDYMTTAQKADVAARTRLLDVTDAIVAAFAASENVTFQPGDYRITMVEGTPLLAFASETGRQVLGFAATLYDPHVYTNAAVVSPIFELTACQRFKSIGLNYEGVPIASPTDASNGVGYQGATFVDLLQGCEDIEVDAYLQDCRYGVKSGNYATPADGYNKHLRIKLRTLRCGYPQAHYLAEDVEADIYAEYSHRSSYLAGVKGFNCNVRFKNQYLAPIQVLMTDATTGTGTSRGCSAGKVWARDMGSTAFISPSWAVGLSLSRVDPGTTYEDIEVHVHVVGADTVASTLGGFVLNSSASAYQPSYTYDWEPTIYLKDIRVSGLIDRSAQTVAGPSVGDFYVNTIDTGAHFATVSGLEINELKLLPSAGANADLYCIVPGLTDQVNVRGCMFTGYPMEFKGPVGKPFNWINCAPITKTSVNSGDTSTHEFIGTDVTSIGQPVTNAHFSQSAFMGASAKLRNVVRDVTLTGASVSLVGVIPPGALVIGVEGKLTTTITGASGYQVGVSGDATRYADRAATASGDAFTPQHSASSEVGSRYYRAYTDLVVTAKTADFTGGTLRVAVQYFSFTAPA
jgi:hypothetical protein